MPCHLLKAEESELGLMEPMEARCECVMLHGDTDPSRVKRMPLRKIAHTVHALGRLLRGVVRGDLPLLTYRCQSCKGIVLITVNDVFPEVQ